MDIWTLLRPLGVAAASIVVALALVKVVHVVLRRIARRDPASILWDLAARCRRPGQLVGVIVALLLAEPAARLGAGPREPVRHVLVLAIIAAGAWLMLRVLLVLEDAATTRFPTDGVDNRHERKVRTQVLVLRRLTAVVVLCIAFAAMLTTFARVRAIGTSLLASAGLLGVVLGFAAQATLGNLIAGLQIAFGNSLRLGDVVVVEEEWGRIEDITLTTVVVHIWDERRLVLPVSYFTQKPFANWTRTQSRLLGAVLLHLDFSVPMDALRAELDRVLEASAWWDHRESGLQMIDATETTVVVRAVASAADASATFDLRCEIREALVAFLVREHPGAMPRQRTDLDPRQEP